MENKSALTIVKVGGNVIDDPIALASFLKDFAALKGHKILVHGGGKLATKTAEGLGITAVFHEGRRITDKPMLDITVMTYAGLINKNIVVTLQSLNANTMGFTGADGNLILSKKRENTGIDFGLVGDIASVNDGLMQLLLKQDIVPVFCAITHDGNGQLLNTNADTIASTIAIALSKHFEVQLLFCFEKKGVLINEKDENSVIKNFTIHDYEILKEQKVIHSGMLPKLDNCFNALSQGVSQINIGGPNMLKSTICTTITS